VLNKTIKYKSFANKWYSENLTSYVSLKRVKRRLIQKNEIVQFSPKQYYSTRQITNEQIEKIVRQKYINSDKKIEEQVYAEDGINWDKVKF